MNEQKGFSMVEALIAITIIFCVVAGVLAGFSSQIALNKKNEEKNMAIALAVSRLEEFQKYPNTQLNLMVQPVIDYWYEPIPGPGQAADRRLILYPGGVEPPTTLPTAKRMRRTLTWDWDGQLLNLHVRVDYFYKLDPGGVRRYVFQVNLHSMRGGA